MGVRLYCIVTLKQIVGQIGLFCTDTPEIKAPVRLNALPDTHAQ